MKFDILKTRRGRVGDKINNEIKKQIPDIKKILKFVDEYEIDNLKTIEKLKREKKLEINRINGAIKQFLNSHPVLTKALIGSLAKRIYGSLLSNKKTNKNFLTNLKKTIFK